jgi:hypothetical protein
VAPSYYSRRPAYTRTYYYGGHPYNAYYYGGWSGYSFYWGHPAWYYWMPFHPAFYYAPPVYYDGGLYPGGFAWTHFFLGLLFFLFFLPFMLWLFGRALFGRGRGVRYSSY